MFSQSSSDTQRKSKPLMESEMKCLKLLQNFTGVP